jgi:hypothetical protein
MSARRSTDFLALRAALCASPRDQGLAAVVYDRCQENGVQLAELLECYGKGEAWEFQYLLAEYAAREFDERTGERVRNCAEYVPWGYLRTAKPFTLFLFARPLFTPTSTMSRASTHSPLGSGYDELDRLLRRAGFREDLPYSDNDKEGLAQERTDSLS